MKAILESELWAEISGYLPEGCPTECWAGMRTDREKLMLRVWKEKASDANPYYPSNKALHSCVYAVKEIMKTAGPYSCNGEALTLLGRFEKRFGKSISEFNEPLVCDLAFFTTHHIITVIRFAGGHRAPIINDVEIDLSVALLPEFSPEDYLKKVGTICERYGVKMLRLS